MKLIEDLGLTKTSTDAHTRHRGVFECPECLRHYTRIYSEGFLVDRCKNCINHGESNTRLYHIWENMLQRCKTNEHYENVEVTEEWKTYIPFRNWAENNGYTPDLSLDRIDTFGNYTPSNCRWTTQSIQCQNTKLLRSSNTSGYRGVTWDKTNKKWIAQCYFRGFQNKLGRFKEAIDAAKAYNKFVVENNLAHPLNTIDEIICK